MAKPALGRGLGALLSGNPVVKGAASSQAANPVPSSHPPVAAEPGERVRKARLAEVVPCPFQPRKNFAPEALQELAESIKEQGIVQPLIVREQGGKFEIIAGERRWRAAQLAGLKEVPVIVRQADNRAVLELALIENLQRENLNPLEESQGYQQLIDEFKLTQEQVATKVGKSRAVVANSLRLLKLPPPVQEQLRTGKLSVGHAKVILGLPEGERQMRAAEQVVRQILNVRQTEELVARMLHQGTAGTPAPTVPSKPKDPHVLNLENRLRERVGTKVSLRYDKGKGSVEIAFFSDAELERVMSLLGVTVD
jgi:ParB family chromosome partitioning protein